MKKRVQQKSTTTIAFCFIYEQSLYFKNDLRLCTKHLCEHIMWKNGKFNANFALFSNLECELLTTYTHTQQNRSNDNFSAFLNNGIASIEHPF